MTTADGQLDWASLQRVAELADRLAAAGPVTVRCKAAEWARSKQGKPQIIADYEIIGGPDAGMQLRTWQTLTADNPQAVAIFLRYIRAHGVDPVAMGGDNTRIVLSMVGVQLSAEVEHSPYMGVQRAHLVNFAPAAGAPAVAPAVATPTAGATAPAQPSELGDELSRLAGEMPVIGDLLQQQETTPQAPPIQ